MDHMFEFHAHYKQAWENLSHLEVRKIKQKLQFPLGLIIQGFQITDAKPCCLILIPPVLV